MSFNSLAKATTTSTHILKQDHWIKSWLPDWNNKAQLAFFAQNYQVFPGYFRFTARHVEDKDRR
jgi:hypothetical protein